MRGEAPRATTSLPFLHTESYFTRLHTMLCRVGSSEKDDMGRALNLEFTFFFFVSNQ